MRRLVGLLSLLALLGVTQVARVDAAGGSIAEKVTVLDESLRVAQRLRDAGMSVSLTRSSDRFVDLSDRAAASHGADLFVSIHNNGSKSRSVVGTEAYYQIGNRFGGELAAQIVRSVSARAGTVYRGAFTRKGDDGDYYHVLRESHTTAILVEGAFLSNPGEARRLADPAFRALIADGIADALVTRLALQLVPQGGGPPPPKTTVAGAGIPAPRNLTGTATGRAVNLSWDPVGLATSYEVWRDGRLIAQIPDHRFTDGALQVGRHRYEVRAVVDVGGAIVEQSGSAVADVVVPWRVVIDPGHGGKDPGAIGRW